MKFETINVYGAKELVESMGFDTSDSYEVHIEDPETLETAPYAFVIGEHDMDRIVHKLLNADADGVDSTTYDIRGMLTVTAKIEDTSLLMLHELNYNTSYDCDPTFVFGAGLTMYLRATYRDLYVLKSHIYERGEQTHKISDNMRAILKWMETLPYQELLMRVITEEED